MSKYFLLFLLVPLFVLALALPFVVAGPGFVPVIAKYSGGPVANGGSIKGTVTLSALPPASEFVIGKDAKVCAEAKRSPRLVVDAATKGLGNVVVYLDGIEQGKPLVKGDFVVDQQDCQYTPHINIVPMRSTLSFKSSDPILHNVHVFQSTPEDPHATGKTALNVAMKDNKVPAMGLGKRALRKPGFLYVRCDAGHIWMSAYVFVVEHPYYAVTDASGKFELTDVPPGTYTLKYWHENWVATPVEKDGAVSAYNYGPPLMHSVKVTVKAGEAATADWQITVQ